MKKFRFKKIDAFSTGLSSGNPAGCVYLDDVISDEDMQKIARELQGFVSEVVFVKTGTFTEDLIFRYFSCEREVEFCGHATVAVLDDLIKNSAFLRKKNVIRIRINSGILEAENRLFQEGKVYVHAPSPVFINNIPDVLEIVRALKLKESDINKDFPIGIIQVGQNILTVPITTSDACLGCSPDYGTLRKFAVAHSLEVIHIFTRECEYQDHTFRVRVFAPVFGYLEDPATGSGNAAFGYHLFRTGHWDGLPIILEQGPDKKNPNLITLSRTSDGSILFGGNGVVRIEGHYCLP